MSDVGDSGRQGGHGHIDAYDLTGTSAAEFAVMQNAHHHGGNRGRPDMRRGLLTATMPCSSRAEGHLRDANTDGEIFYAQINAPDNSVSFRSSRGAARSRRRIRDAVGRYLSLSGAVRDWCNNRVVCRRSFLGHGASRSSRAGRHPALVYLFGNRSDGRDLLQDNKAAGTLPDLYCHYRFGARSNRARGRRASHGDGYPRGFGSNSFVVFCRSGAEIRIKSIPIKWTSGGPEIATRDVCF
jgi:hypothetical protein